jgi:endonuclease YncB( thermonuclease family)
MLQIMLIFLLTATPSDAGPSGRIEVSDADTIRVGGVKVRLYGIDAPETEQTCTRKSGEVWPCGRWATRQVTRAYEGRRANCETLDRDQYGRVVARCFVDGEDINAEIVRRGLATAYVQYSRDYVDVEKEALIAERGIFASDMMAPGQFRRANQPAPQVVTGDCRIKGNISGNGRIYHQPHNRDYSKVRINTRKGERYFCTAAEAEAAGWRAARN